MDTLLFKILVLNVKMEQQGSNNVANKLVLLLNVYKDFIFLNLIVMLALNMLVHVLHIKKLIHVILDIPYNKVIV